MTAELLYNRINVEYLSIKGTTLCKLKLQAVENKVSPCKVYTDLDLKFSSIPEHEIVWFGIPMT
jgi:hypothetical protein